jgi:hypothetical protein
MQSISLVVQTLLFKGNGQTTAKLKGKQSSIATVRDLLRTFSTFSAPLCSYYRLPLI